MEKRSHFGKIDLRAGSFCDPRVTPKVSREVFIIAPLMSVRRPECSLVISREQSREEEHWL